MSEKTTWDLFTNGIKSLDGLPSYYIYRGLPDSHYSLITSLELNNTGKVTFDKYRKAILDPRFAQTADFRCWVIK